ncbi:MAG: hypothetical protein ACRD4U_04975, partial [Candidatus Acidiferrales bacterium]
TVRQSAEGVKGALANFFPASKQRLTAKTIFRIVVADFSVRFEGVETEEAPSLSVVRGPVRRETGCLFRKRFS